MRPRALLAAALAGAALGAAAPARAAFFASESVDGPSPDILQMGDLDVAQDGGSAVVYLKRTDAIPHVWAARMVNGAWQAPERLDAGLGGASSEPRVAVSDGGRAVAVWINSGRLWSSLRESAGAAWTPPVEIHGGPVQSVSVGMSLHGVGYAAFAIGTTSRDVRAARLTGSVWTVYDAPLDVDPARDAGGGRGPRIAAAADGTALAAWEEVGGDGRRRVHVRRVLRDRLSQFPGEASVPDLEGHGGGDARNPDVGMDWDSSFGWVALEQDFDDGGIRRTRVIGRRLVGVGLDPPIALDPFQWGGADSAVDPDVDVTGRRRALAAYELRPQAGVGAAVLQIDVFGSIGRIDNAGGPPPDPAAAHASNGEGAFAWFEDTQVVGRYWNRDDVLEGETALASPDLGPAQPALGLDASANRLADVAIAFIQGGATDRRLVVAHWDRPLRPVTPSTATQAWQRTRRPRLTWGAVSELWGSAQYRVEIGGLQVATQASNVLNLPFDLPDGSHPWRVVTIDRRGQESPGGERRLNIDATSPIALLATTGTLRAGQPIRFVARDDPPPQPPPAPGAEPPPPIRTSGLARVTASFGDRTRGTATRELRHVYRRKGRYRVRMVVVDKAGNQAIVKLVVKVANPRKSRSR